MQLPITYVLNYEHVLKSHQQTELMFTELWADLETLKIAYYSKVSNCETDLNVGEEQVSI